MLKASKIYAVCWRQARVTGGQKNSGRTAVEIVKSLDPGGSFRSLAADFDIDFIKLTRNVDEIVPPHYAGSVPDPADVIGRGFWWNKSERRYIAAVAIVVGDFGWRRRLMDRRRGARTDRQMGVEGLQ